METKRVGDGAWRRYGASIEPGTAVRGEGDAGSMTTTGGINVACRLIDSSQVSISSVSADEKYDLVSGYLE